MGGAAALWGLAIGLGKLSDNSALTHLATGRLILDEGIPRQDPFSFTAAGKPWIVYSWLAAAGQALADRAGGGHGIQLARAVLCTGLAVLAWRLTRPAQALIGRILVVGIVLAVGTAFWAERPLLVALALFAALVVMVEEDRARPWAIVGLFWLWVNVHGSFPLGLVYLGVRLAGRRLDRTPLGRLPRVVALSAAGTLAGAINPLGPKLLIAPIRLLSRHELLERVIEWRPPDFSDPSRLVFLVGLVGALVVCGRRRSWEDTLPVALFGVSACLAQRNIPMAAIVLAAPLARGLQGLGSIKGERRSPATAFAAAAMVVFALILVVSAMDEPAYDLRGYPVRQLDWLKDQGLLDRRMATQDFVGNYLIALRGRQANVFFDDRFDLYPAGVIRDSIALVDGNEGWQRRLDKYRIDIVLWERSEPLAALLALDPGWEVVQRDAKWLVAVRAGLRH